MEDQKEIKSRREKMFSKAIGKNSSSGDNLALVYIDMLSS